MPRRLSADFIANIARIKAILFHLYGQGIQTIKSFFPA